MLSEFQQKVVWEEWLSAEMRANYFADLAGRYQANQRLLTWLTLIFSSGAATTLLSDWLPRTFGWVRPVLALSAAGVSFFSLVAQNHKLAVDCSDLHFRWNRLANDYEALWDNTYSVDAQAKLKELKDKSAELSRSSTAVPYRSRIMLKWQNHVERHHYAREAAA